MSKAAAINKLNETELRLGIAGTSASWHQHHVASPTIYIGGLAMAHTERHILSIFEQYGTLTHVNLIRDPHTNQSKQFAFANYADARSAVLAVDNLNNAQFDGITLTVDHVDDYRMPTPAEAFDTTPTTAMTAVGDTHSGTPTDDSSAYPHNFTQLTKRPEVEEVERKRQFAVMARLENLRKRRRIEATNSTDQQHDGRHQRNQSRTTNDSGAEADEIAPIDASNSHHIEEQAHEDTITPRGNPSDLDHAQREARGSMSREEKRQHRIRKERRKAQRAAIRQARAERRAHRELQNR